MKKKIIFLIGPTSVGKTDVSIELAKKINAEILNCDSMQVYKGMDIITRKPTKAYRRKIPHHLINIISPSQDFNVADFRKRALDIIKDIHKTKKLPLMVGGTPLYMKALVDGLFPSPDADVALRKELKGLEDSKGAGLLHDRLKSIDPETAGLLHPNDTRRIIRALEVFMKTGRKMSELKKKTKSLKGKFDIKIFCLNRPRDELYKRIDKSVDRMFRCGAIAECRQLKKKGISMTASQALGYKEICSYLENKCTMPKTKDLLKRNTRRFAKRQLSWFRNDNRIIWIQVRDNECPKEIAGRILSHLGSDT